MPATMTAAQYAQLPETNRPMQLIHGELIMSPSPIPYHQRTIQRLFRLIDGFVSQNHLGEVLISPLDVFFSDTEVYQPDVLFLANNNPSFNAKNKITSPPDLVVEVLSPGNAQHDLVTKRLVYEQYGVKEYWIVSLEDTYAEVLALDNGLYRIHSRAHHSGTLHSQLLAGFSCTLSQIIP